MNVDVFYETEICIAICINYYFPFFIIINMTMYLFVLTHILCNNGELMNSVILINLIIKWLLIKK